MIHLLRSGYDHLGYRFLNRYLSHTGDYPGLILLRYYLVYRALVLAKVSLLRFEQENEKYSGRIAPEYNQYMSLAESFTVYKPPLLIITHGFSGSGKSVLSSKLAENIGAIHIRSDIERKRLFGFRATVHTGSGIDSGLYAAEVNQKTYCRLAELASDVISGGLPVIIDAAFLRYEQRDLFKELADSRGAHFFIINCHVSDDVLQQRILQRGQENKDPSEATIDVLRHQQQSAQALTDAEWVNAISVNTVSDDALITLLETVRKALSQADNRRSIKWRA
jgi:predicted kinase